MFYQWVSFFALFLINRKTVGGFIIMEYIMNLLPVFVLLVCVIKYKIVATF